MEYVAGQQISAAFLVVKCAPWEEIRFRSLGHDDDGTESFFISFGTRIPTINTIIITSSWCVGLPTTSLLVRAVCCLPDEPALKAESCRVKSARLIKCPDCSATSRWREINGYLWHWAHLHLFLTDPTQDSNGRLFPERAPCSLTSTGVRFPTSWR